MGDGRWSMLGNFMELGKMGSTKPCGGQRALANLGIVAYRSIRMVGVCWVPWLVKRSPLVT